MELIKNIADIISKKKKSSIIKPVTAEIPKVSKPRKIIAKDIVDVPNVSKNVNEAEKPAVVKKKSTASNKSLSGNDKKSNSSSNNTLRSTSETKKANVKKEIGTENKTSIKKESVSEKKTNVKKEASPEKKIVIKKELSPEKKVIIKKELSPEKKIVARKESIPDKKIVIRKESVPEKKAIVKKEPIPDKRKVVKKKSATEGSNVPKKEITTEVAPNLKEKNLPEKVVLKKKQIDDQIADMIKADKTILQEYKEKQEILKGVAVQAELDKKIFCILHTHGYIRRPIKEELLKRGWLEYKIDRQTIPRKTRSDPQIKNDVKIDHTEKALRSSSSENKFYVIAPVAKPSIEASNEDIQEFGSKNDMSSTTYRQRRHSISHPRLTSEELKKTNEILQEINPEVSFIWLSSKPDLQLKNFLNVPDIGNKFQKTSFCSKLGLCNNLHHNKKLMEKLKFPIKIPRMYNLGDALSENNFMTEYYIISAASILKWFVNALSLEGVSAVQASNGEVPTRILDLSIRICERYVQCIKKGESIEDRIKLRENWDNFLVWFYKIINGGAKFQTTTPSQLYLLHCRSVEVLRTFRDVRPETECDGFCNLWIVKPYHASCGRGIFLTNNLHYLNELDQKRYIIQKYIERPYLIRKTKFDIRQWFLVTSLRPIEIWLYKDSYLRFCTQPFDIRNLHESVHLTNNAVQKKYASEVSLPCQNMWDSTTFTKFLWKMGYSNLWDKIIYPSMKDAIINVMRCSQPTFDGKDTPYCQKKGWFEIYGADFMLTSNLKDGPWLIEINEGPALNPSTPITERLCQQMLRDVIKVVVDRPIDEKADTGSWELVYKQKDYTESRV